MSSDMPPAGDQRSHPGDPDFEAIYDAVMATDRGRWFLSEYARRNRRTDTTMVLTAIDRLLMVARADEEAREALLHAMKRPGRSGPDLQRLRAGLDDMAAAIARTRSDTAAGATDDAHSGRALSEILGAAERIEELAWTMRVQGMDPHGCDRLDGYATAIYAACAREALAGRRARKLVHVLRYLEARMEGLSALWDQAARAADQAAPEQTAPPREATADPGATAPCEPMPSAQPQATPATREEPRSSSSIPPPPATVWQSPEPAPPAEPPPPDPDAIIADLRAFAAFVMAQCRKETGPATGASEPLPAAALPPRADPPQGPAAPRPGAATANDAFADVMALSEEERIALFS